MSERLISRSAFARLAGVSPAAITKACKSKLAGARVGDRIDIEHPDAETYLSRHPSPTGDKHERAAGQYAAAREKGTTRPEGAATSQNGAGATTLVVDDVHDETNLGEYGDLPLRELVRRFGTERVFKDWLEALKKIEDVQEKRLNNMQQRGKLVSRDMVATHIFGAIEASFQRLLNDIPRTLVARLFAAARSDIEEAEATEMVRDILSTELQALKDSSVKLLEK